MGLTIRDLEEADHDEVIGITISAYNQYEATLPPDRWENYRASILASLDNKAVAAQIIAEEDGVIVGSVQLFLDSTAAYGAPELGITGPIIRYLAVPPEHRGKGIASALIHEAAARSVKLGANWLHLHTSDMMASAINLYERLGFERATDHDILNGNLLIKSYRLNLQRQTASL